MKHDYIKIIEKSNDVVNYNRPFFHLPDLTSDAGNTFVMFGNFLNTLKSAKYTKEAEFINKFFVRQNFGQFVLPKENAFSSNNIDGVILFMNKFVKMIEDAEIIEDNDEYVIKKVLKNSDNVKNLPFLKSVTLQMASTFASDPDSKYLVTEKNSFERNMLFYLPITDTLSLMTQYPEFKNHFFDKDVFGQYFFTKSTSDDFLEIISFINSNGIDMLDFEEKLIEEDVFSNNQLQSLFYDLDRLLMDVSKIRSFSTYSTQHESALKLLKFSYGLEKEKIFFSENISDCIFNPENSQYNKCGAILLNFHNDFEKLISSGHNIDINFKELNAKYKEFSLLKLLDESNKKGLKSNIVSNKAKI